MVAMLMIKGQCSRCRYNFPREIIRSFLFLRTIKAQVQAFGLIPMHLICIRVRLLARTFQQRMPKPLVLLSLQMIVQTRGIDDEGGGKRSCARVKYAYSLSE